MPSRNAVDAHPPRARQRLLLSLHEVRPQPSSPESPPSSASSSTLLVLCLPLGGIGRALWFLLHHSGPFAIAIMYISFGLLGLVFLAAVFGLISASRAPS